MSLLGQWSPNYSRRNKKFADNQFILSRIKAVSKPISGNNILYFIS